MITPTSKESLDSAWRAPVQCYIPEYTRLGKCPTDRRHIDILYNILATCRYRHTLEIGCLYGASSSAFLNALRRGWIDSCAFCEIAITPQFKRLLAEFGNPPNAVVYNQSSLELLKSDHAWDLVFIDGNHTLQQVQQEIVLLLGQTYRPRVLTMHDVSSTVGGWVACEGPMWAYHYLQFQTDPKWYCLIDYMKRDGEATHRGFGIACRELEDYIIIRDICGMLV